jgi:4-amino-4-deoxy-L-arabinose transferase-like glycosyltransferase
MSTSVPQVAFRVRSWPIALLLALAPLWLVGILDRGLWTPDEPREADIAWRMSEQSDRTLPQLAGVPFLEKPPLSYWLSAAGISAFDEPRAANIVYAAVTALAVGGIAAAMAGAGAAFLSGLLAGSLLIAFRVSVWLAPDACLLAGCAVALLGAYIGYTSEPGRRKLGGYTLMHLGAAIGFMAKSAPGWLVPALTLLTLIAWERKGSELRRIELYAGLLLQAAIIGPWIYAVTLSPIGHDALLTLFWHNIVGRFTRISGPTALDYTTGHPNWPGKYLLELPVYVLPWTLVVVAALRRAWLRVRAPGRPGTAWRFSIAAALPFLLLLSLAATARDIYAAPAMLGISLLGALWAQESQNNMSRLDRLALRGTRVLVGLIACVFSAFLLLLAAEDRLDYGPMDQLNRVIRIVAAIATLLVAAIGLWLAARAQRLGNAQGSLVHTFAAYAGALCVAGIAAFPAIDQWQNLPLLADAIKFQTSGSSLGLLDPDETTLAMLDDRLLTPSTVLTTQGSDATQVVASWFHAHGKQGRVLVLLPGHGSGGLSRVLDRIHPRPPPGDGVAGVLTTSGTASLVARFELPQGRRFALLGPPAS